MVDFQKDHMDGIYLQVLYIVADFAIFRLENENQGRLYCLLVRDILLVTHLVTAAKGGGVVL